MVIPPKSMADKNFNSVCIQDAIYFRNSKTSKYIKLDYDIVVALLALADEVAQQKLAKQQKKIAPSAPSEGRVVLMNDCSKVDIEPPPPPYEEPTK